MPTIGRHVAKLSGYAPALPSSGDVTRPSRLRSLVGPGFRLLSGDDALGLAFLAHGGDGCISVTSNVVPGLCRNMFLAWRQGPATRAQRLAGPIAKLTAALFCETNPVALKYALSLFGLMSPRVSLPLVELSDQHKPGIAAILAELCDTYSESMIGRIGGPIRAGRRAMVG
jgi:4-hydroxy-tetrahydrodipicolinate synthase